MRPALFLAAAMLVPAAAAAQVGGTPPPTPAPPSNEGTQNPYGGPRDSDAGDTSVYLNNERETAKAMRDRAAREAEQANLPRGSAAAAGDLAAGSEVRDRKGIVVGTIEAVEADGAIVSTGAAKVKVPLDAFGKNKKGLLLGITKAEFDAVVAGATAAPSG